MRSIGIEELKILQIDILNMVDSFCRKNNINYWLDYGTLLGAIRHKGYIPWDDDIDIGMLRADYDKFMNSFNTYSERYEFLCPERNADYCYAYGKVVDKNTLLYEPNKNGRKLAVNIDVFVYDNAPNNDNELSKMFDKRDFYRKLNVAHSQNRDIIGGLYRNIGFAIARFLTMPFKKNYFALKMVSNSKKYANSTTKRVGSFMSYYRVSSDKKVFATFLDAEFEGKMYKIPVEYDIWLKTCYKNYMEFPPMEKRVSTHVFEAYMLNDHKCATNQVQNSYKENRTIL